MNNDYHHIYSDVMNVISRFVQLNNFRVEDLYTEIRAKNLPMRVAPAHTVKQYLFELVDDGIITFNAHENAFYKVKIKGKAMIGTKKIVMIVGPYIGGTYEEIEANIREAEKYQVALANAGIGVFCPHNHTEHFEEKANAMEEYYKELDLEILKRAVDVILALPKWKESKGTLAEMAVIKEIGLPVFYPKSPDDIDDIIECVKETEKPGGLISALTTVATGVLTANGKTMTVAQLENEYSNQALNRVVRVFYVNDVRMSDAIINTVCIKEYDSVTLIGNRDVVENVRALL